MLRFWIQVGPTSRCTRIVRTRPRPPPKRKTYLRSMSLVLSCGSPSGFSRPRLPWYSLTRGVRSRVYPFKSGRPGLLTVDRGSACLPQRSIHAVQRGGTNRNSPQNSLRSHRYGTCNPLKGPLPSPRPVIRALPPQEAGACQFDVPRSQSRRRDESGCRASDAPRGDFDGSVVTTMDITQGGAGAD